MDNLFVSILRMHLGARSDYTRTMDGKRCYTTLRTKHEGMRCANVLANMSPKYGALELVAMHIDTGYCIDAMF